jgi:hypothetical protein
MEDLGGILKVVLWCVVIGAICCCCAKAFGVGGNFLSGIFA